MQLCLLALGLKWRWEQEEPQNQSPLGLQVWSLQSFHFGCTISHLDLESWAHGEPKAWAPVLQAQRSPSRTAPHLPVMSLGLWPPCSPQVWWVFWLGPAQAMTHPILQGRWHPNAGSWGMQLGCTVAHTSIQWKCLCHHRSWGPRRHRLACSHWKHTQGPCCAKGNPDMLHTSSFWWCCHPDHHVCQLSPTYAACFS